MSSFYTSSPKIMIIWYTVPEIWRVTDVIVIFHFGISSFYTCVPRNGEKWCATDGWTEVGPPSKN